jgi:DNA repair protein NreA
MYDRNTEEIKKRITEGWNQILRSNFSNLSEKILGESPPSVFVSSYTYPKVKVGPLFSPLQIDSAILDHPEKWAGKSLEDIIRYKLSLIRGTHLTHVKTNLNADRYIQSLQELAMATRSTEIEVAFERKPKLNLEEISSRTASDSGTIQFGRGSELENLKLPSNISSDKKIEKVFYDIDFRAIEAINYLYEEGIEISKISKILSLGMIGIKKNRRLVPTKWSIPAIDQIISSDLIKNTNTFQPLDRTRIYKYAHLGNYYSIALIPDELWSFEMHEAWIDKKGDVNIETDSEDSRGLNNYPKIGGSYFAARLAVIEFLNGQKRSASVIVLREIHPEYILPVGVWQIREGIREALRMKGSKFENIDMALSFACNNLTISKNEWIRNSRLVKARKSNGRISDYFGKS